MKIVRINDYREYKLTDSEVIKRILAGEKELYEVLMRRHNQKLYRVVRSYVKSDEEIQDLMQDTYLKAYEKLYQFKHDALFSTWLVRIGINESLAMLRTKGRQAHLFEQTGKHTDVIALEIPDAEQPNPERKMIRQEAKYLLEKAIDALEEKYRLVYILKEVEGMSLPEISVCLDVTPGNVKVRLHRARLMIKEGLYELSQQTDVFEFGSRRCDVLVDNMMQRI
jgi:RNA polymerase sigma factor (sigma-70 family)